MDSPAGQIHTLNSARRRRLARRLLSSDKQRLEATGIRAPFLGAVNPESVLRYVVFPGRSGHKNAQDNRQAPLPEGRDALWPSG